MRYIPGNLRTSILILAAAATVASCTKTEIYEAPNGEGLTIQAKSKHSDTTDAATRTPFEGTISGTNTLTAKVLTYKASNTLWSDGTMTFANTASPVQYTSATQTKYDANQTEEYTMHGLYPATGWGETTPPDQSTGTMSYSSLDGKTDVMAAKTTTTPTGAPTLEFNHLLTKLIVKIVAADAQSDTEWKTLDNIQLLKINGNADKVCKTLNYKLSDKTTTFATPGGPMDFYQMTGDDAYNDFKRSAAPVNITTTAATVAYCLVNPALITTDNFTLNVIATTATNGQRTKEVPITLDVKSGETTTAGYAYIITLTFDMTGIKAGATIKAWIPGDSTTETIEV